MQADDEHNYRVSELAYEHFGTDTLVVRLNDRNQVDRFQELGAGDVIDVISPHPYNMHRARPLPEEQPILEQLPEFRAFAAQHRLPWEVWAGEVGFSSFTLTVLTAECIQSAARSPCACPTPATHRVFWEGLFLFRMCAWCADWTRQVGTGVGCEVKIRLIDVERGVRFDPSCRS